MDKKDVYENLTYSMKRKTYKIIECKNDIIEYQRQYKNYSTNIKICTKFIIISSLIIFAQLMNTNSLDLKRLLLLFIGFIIGYLFYKYYYNLNKKNLAELEKTKNIYENLRQDNILSLDNEYHYEFCNHSQPCICKEQYVIYMDNKENINLIFKDKNLID